MIDRLKFRGWMKADQKWYYAPIANARMMGGLSPEGDEIPPETLLSWFFGQVSQRFIDPETVGQQVYCDLTYIDGSEIWEDDIALAKAEGFMLKGIIEWCPHAGAFMLCDPEGNEEWGLDDIDTIEKLGTVHDKGAHNG